MSVRYDIRCVDCRCVAPDVGDGGYLGCPSIHEDEEDSVGPSFGYYFIPLSALGICPLDLQRFSEWLFQHSEHEVHIAGDLPTPPHLPRGSLHWDDEETDAGHTTASQGDPSLDGYVWGRYEIECLSCREAYSSLEPEWLMFSGLSDDEGVHKFLDRWRPAEDVASHRLYGIADPQGTFIRGLTEFLQKHRPPLRPPFTDSNRHNLQARVIRVSSSSGPKA
jgi:hypothetical protein